MKLEFRKYFAEMIGTFVLVFVAVGTAVFTHHATGEVNLVATALAFGLAVVAMAYAIGSISGCHINPAVSLGFYATGKMKTVDFIAYFVSQVIGAIIAAALIYGIIQMAGARDYIMGTNAYEGLGTNDAASIGIGLIVEIALTFVFVFTILCVVRKTDNAKVAGLVIGLTLALVHFFGISLTGTSVNPARSFGPAIFGGVEAMRQVWLFIVAPLAGALLAAITFRLLYCKKQESDE